MKRILAATDLSPDSRRVVRAAATLAGLDGEVVLVHSIPPPPRFATAARATAERGPYFMDKVEQAAFRHLNRARRMLARRGISVQTICASGLPAAQIVSQARKCEADYIVVGSHVHSTWHNLVVGNTTAGVLERATCPVLVVPPTRPE